MEPRVPCRASCSTNLMAPGVSSLPGCGYLLSSQHRAHYMSCVAVNGLIQSLWIPLSEQLMNSVTGRCWVKSIDRELCWKHPWVMLPDCLLSLFYELYVSTQWVAQLQTMTPPRALLLVWLLGDGSFEFRFPPPKLSKTSHSRFYTSSLCIATWRHISGLLPLSHVLQYTG